MKTTQFPLSALRLIAILAVASGSYGATLNYSGNFPNNPNALFEVQFTTSVASNLTIATSSISNNGFQGVLWLFNSSGTTQLTKNDPPVDVEAMINTPEPAGTYLLILSAFDQHYCLANSVCNGVVYGNTGWSYNGDFGNDTLAYAFSISTDQGSLTKNSATFDLSPTQAFPAAVPEPASAALLLIGGASLLLRRAWVRLL